MSYISPATNVWLLRGVNLEQSYNHTFYPSQGLNGQFTSFITGYLKPNVTLDGKTYSFHLTQYSYQRSGRNVIRVKIPNDLLYDINYMVFQNGAYTDQSGNSKIFYAFVTKVEYINNNTTAIHYEIDVMQTWFFDYTLNACFVEREHSATDERGGNIIPEPVSIGDYATGNIYSSGLFTDTMCIVIAASADLDSLTNMLKPAPGRYTCGVYNNVSYISIPCTQQITNIRTTVQAVLDGLAVLNRANTIINIYMCPLKFIPSSDEDETFSDSYNAAHYGYIQPNVSPNYGSYVPRNNKLLTYPYCYYTVSNQEGTIRTFKYEYFLGGSQNRFEVYYDNSIFPQVTLIPVGYLEAQLQGGNAYTNHDFSITIKDFPKCAWATNDLMAKIVQMGIGVGISALTGLITDSTTQMITKPSIPLMSINDTDYMINGRKARDLPYNDELSGANFEQSEYTKNLGSEFKSTVKSIGNSLSIPKITSAVNLGNTNYVSGGLEFWFREYHVKEEYARILDDFFDMYGYATNRVKVPNRNVRQHWTYTKTTNCTLNGQLPQDDIEKIQSIYNNGITFWTSLANIGDYSLAPQNTAPVG